VGLKSDGSVVALGWNTSGQCNVGPWTGITQVSAGGQHTVGLKSDDTVVALGLNTNGQCDIGSWSGITQVSAGERHTVGLGSVVAVGDNEYCQCNLFDWNLISVTIGQVASATGTGMITVNISTGYLQSLAALGQSQLTCTRSPGLYFPHGFLSFTIINIIPGSTVTITITLPSAMPAGTQYMKCINGNWVDCTSLLGSNDGDNVITLTVIDGGLGDADGVANGTIVDPGGPSFGGGAARGAEGAATGESSSTTIRSPNMNITYLSVNHSQTVANKPVTISANVVNRGGMVGSTRVALKINGKVEETKVVTVGPGGSRPVKFNVTEAEPGTYTVILGNQRTSFLVTEDTASTAGVDGGTIAMILLGFLVLAFFIVIAFSFRRRPSY